MLLKGNCLDTLKALPDNSVDCVVTDPPYELGFMGKSWDNSGIAYNVELWGECLRVLKPGGHLLAFGGSRTYHRLASAVEDSGFEIRDQIMWLYGSGFPKSKNVALAIDKGEGHPNRGKAIPTASTYQASDVNETNKLTSNPVPPYEAKSDIAQQWQGWGTALKPAHEPIVVARKPLIKTVANNVLTYGTGAINIDGSRVGSEERYNAHAGNKETGFTASDDRSEASKGLYAGNSDGGSIVQGRWPANVMITHSHGCIQKASASEIVGSGAKASSGFVNGYENDGFVGKEITNAVWACVEGCPTLGFPDSKGGTWNTTAGARHFNNDGEPTLYKTSKSDNSEGSAARYFSQTAYDETDLPDFIYQAKANKRERNAGLEVGNTHPTVKPLALMRQLVRLVCPPNGVVLDPFLGSGTTAVAAVLEGFDWIGCELTEDYFPIIEARVAWAENQPLPKTPEAIQPTLFEEQL